MLLPLNWLKEHINLDCDIKTYTDRLSLSGSHVESVEDFSEGNENIVTAQILSIEKHPNADKLSLVTIDFGEQMTIITGAKNMKTGDKVAFAKPGAHLKNGLVIKPVKLKGIESNGMLCSYEELGFSSNMVPKNSRDGIIILDPDTEIGQNICNVLQIDLPVVEFEITPNRSDCLSIVGMARESAATFGEKLKPKEIQIKNEEDDITDYFNGVEVQTENCLRYVGRVAKNVQVKESPQWMKNYLMQAGMRPINNIVDITNFVMLETGQPIHAFDINTLEEKKIIVRQAEENEILKTLDGQERVLDPSMVVIADGKKGNAIAGIMGGMNSEIEEDTKVVFIESATFDKEVTRKASKKLGLRTEASQRFEKGVSPQLCRKACDRVCELLEMTDSAVIVKNAFDVYNKKEEKTRIELVVEKVDGLLGTKIEKQEMIDILTNLDFDVEDQGDRLLVTVPSVRMDVTIYQDLIEEIGRIHGFHKIKPQPIRGEILKGTKEPMRVLEDRVKDILYSLQLMEVSTYSFISPKSYEKIQYREEEKNIVRILNPLGEDYSVMRTTLLSNMMNVLELNSKYKADSMRCYELGNTFFNQEGLPYEKKKLVCGMYGDVDFYDLKDVVENLLHACGIRNAKYVKETMNETFHKGRCANVLVNGEKLAVMGEVSFDVMEKYDISKRVYLMELDMDCLFRYQKFDKLYRKIIKYPEISHDLALVVDREMESAALEKVMLENGEGLLKNIQLFDIYTGEHVEKGKKSLAYNLKYQADDRTLMDAEVEKVEKNILNGLEKLGATLRS